MRLSFRKSFERDLKRINDPVVLRRVRRSIEQVEAAEHLSRVRGARRLSGSGSLYRIRIGEYRIGLAVEASDVEIRAGSAPPRHLSVFSVKLVQGAGLVQRERVGFLERGWYCCSPPGAAAIAATVGKRRPFRAAARWRRGLSVGEHAAGGPASHGSVVVCHGCHGAMLHEQIEPLSPAPGMEI